MHVFGGNSGYHGDISVRHSNALFALTFNGNDVLSDLILQQRLLHTLQQLVDGVDVRMDGLEPLDLSSDGG